MKILVAVDLSASSQAVVGQAKKLALGLSARLWLLHVAEPTPDFIGNEVDTGVMRDVLAERYHQEHRQLQEFAEGLRQSGVECTALLVQGDTAQTIVREAERLGVEMIVLGSHGKGPVKQLLLGSASEGVIRKSPMPVHVVPTRE